MFIQSPTVVSGIMLNRAISLPSWIKRLVDNPNYSTELLVHDKKKKKSKVAMVTVSCSTSFNLTKVFSEVLLYEKGNQPWELICLYWIHVPFIALL